MLDSYRLRMAALGGYEGEARRKNSQKIMDASWMRDAATKPVYVKWCDKGLPIVDDDDYPVYAKYNVKSYHNITGDEVAYLLEFRLDDMKERSDIKVGSYVYIPNETGNYEWWLIWHYDDRPQFRQFSILKCTYVYKWTSFKDGHRVIHQCLGVTRNQNNYNNMFNDLQDIMNIKVKESKRNFRNKNAISEMKNLLNEINLKSESAEEKINDLKYRNCQN